MLRPTRKERIAGFASQPAQSDDLGGHALGPHQVPGFCREQVQCFDGSQEADATPREAPVESFEFAFIIEKT